MRFLNVAEFDGERSSGAAGSILAIGEALERRGHEVDHVWRSEEPRRLRHPRLSQLLEQPRRQMSQAAAALEQRSYDVVTVSQPYAHPIFEKLASRHPSTLFLNRTHGWEDRLHEAHWRYGLLGPLSRSARMLSEAAAWMTRRQAARTLRSCHGLIAPSRLCADFVRREYGLGEEKLAVIPYGLDEDFLAVAAAEEAPARPAGDPARLLFVGNYIPLKGTAMLEGMLPALAEVRQDFNATFVVPPESLAAVEAAYRPALGPRLRVEGWRDRGELIDLYRDHDVFLFSSLFEGFGKTFQEAMACGLCVVGFDQGGSRDLAEDGEEALISSTGDTAAFRAALERVLDDPAERRRIGENARHRIRGQSWDRTAAATEEFVEARRRALGRSSP